MPIKVQKLENQRYRWFQILGCFGFLSPLMLASRGLDVTLVRTWSNFDVPFDLLRTMCIELGVQGRATHWGRKPINFCQSCWGHLSFQRYWGIMPHGCGWAWLEIPNSSGCARDAFLPNGKAYARELDHLNCKRDKPDYKGAFHDKKEHKKPKIQRKGGKEEKKRGIRIPKAKTNRNSVEKPAFKRNKGK